MSVHCQSYVKTEDENKCAHVSCGYGQKCDEKTGKCGAFTVPQLHIETSLTKRIQKHVRRCSVPFILSNLNDFNVQKTKASAHQCSATTARNATKTLANAVCRDLTIRQMFSCHFTQKSRAIEYKYCLFFTI